LNLPVYGLVLAGGRSRRMGRDKAVLEYAGETQLTRAMQLLQPLVQRAFVSVRADQLQDPARAGFELVADRVADQGPIGGIQAALEQFPGVAWLVAACDLPFLTTATLQQLLASRAPTRDATAFTSRHDGKPQPLCAIYEPGCRVAIERWLAAGNQCPRKFLAQADTELMELAESAALDNINTADEYGAAHAALLVAAPGAPRAGSPPARRIEVRYFAPLREEAGLSSESLESSARTARELYAELRGSRGLQLWSLQVGLTSAVQRRA
jgi:molybdopterin-guanine dinucleotide biosynthesis protein A